MARAKTPRVEKTTANRNKQIITMPEAGAPTLVKKSAPSGNSSPASLDEAIRERAFELYTERGCTPGHEHEDWLRAEQEVKAHSGRQQTA
jgi:hypothetical protein